ncbi:hypothetical protein [Motilimonas cestriensis]|uniref:hypothetical protein n=1 Tax=Motilimonas cestriensis TaxID=2742685 RepID=UPI003DA3E8C3
MFTFFICICVLLGLLGLLHILFDMSVRGWPEASGIILTYCEIATLKSQIVSELAVYSLSARFDYEYNGKVFTNGKLCLSGAIKSQDLASLTSRKQHLNMQLSSARVCPLLPSLAVLMPDPLINKVQYYFITVFGFGVAGLTLWVDHTFF